MSWISKVLGRGGAKPSRDEEDDLPEAAPFTAPLQVESTAVIVGDVHGRADLLDVLLEQLSQLDADYYVFVGDYVDRGEDSAQVLRKLFEMSKSYSNVVCLKGNHEKMMLDFLRRPLERGERWLRNGGLQTLASFGLDGVRDTMPPEEIATLAEELRTRMPDGMEDWMSDLPIKWRNGNLWVVHAGANPDTPIEDQGDRILLWGHRKFRHRPRSDGNWVAHGHTIVTDPSSEDGRIALDTGAYATGRLTAAVVTPNSETPLRFIST